MFGDFARSCLDDQPPCSAYECLRNLYAGMMFDQEISSATFYANVVDLANTLAAIMICCRLEGWKAEKTIDVSIYAILHYDTEYDRKEDRYRKRMRKENIFYELGTRCSMNRLESHLTYTIIQRGFKAIHYEPTKEEILLGFEDECVYVAAARSTTEAFARVDGLIYEEKHPYFVRIRRLYRNFYERMQQRLREPSKEGCQCCLCARKGARYAEPIIEPCDVKKIEKPVKRPCPKCCQVGETIRRPKPKSKRAKCGKSKNPCACGKRNPFKLDFVKSIWERSDMKTYHRNTIEGDHTCDDWIDVGWLKHIIDERKPSGEYCIDWFDPSFLKIFQSRDSIGKRTVNEYEGEIPEDTDSRIETEDSKREIQNNVKQAIQSKDTVEQIAD